MFRILLSVFALASAPSLATAAELSFQFSGRLTSITDQYGILNGQFALGNTIGGTLVYETSVTEAPSTLADPTIAAYIAVKQFTVTINGITFDGDRNSLPGILQVWDDAIIGTYNVDTLAFSSPLDYTPPIPGMGAGTVVSQSNLSLFDFTGSASSDGTSIPYTIDISKYESRSISIIQLNVDTNQAFHLIGSLTSVSPIPEVNTIFLFPLGFAFFLARNWRRAVS